MEAAAREAAAPTGSDDAAAADGAAASADRVHDAAPAPGSDPAPEAAPAPAPVAAEDPASERAAAPASSRRTPPPFWMVLAIAVIALLLGIVIGYLLGSMTTLSTLESGQMNAASTSQDQTAEGDASAYELPAGHPDVTVDDDGTAHVSDAGSAAE